MPSIADSVVEMVQWVFPEHAGAPGQIHGGRMMQWITEAGTLAAGRGARGAVRAEGGAALRHDDGARRRGALALRVDSERVAGGRAVREHDVRRQDADGARRGWRDPVDAVLQGPGHDGVPGRAGFLLPDLHARGRQLQVRAQPRGHLLARDWRQGPE